MVSRWKQRLYSGITKFGESSVGRRVAVAVESCDRAFENDNSDHETNGESWLLGQVASVSPKVVFDVGANRGTWALAASSRMPSATVHSFEPIPETFAVLDRTVGSRRNVQTRNIALTSSESGSLTMYLGSHDTLATAVENPLNGGDEVTVDALTGDSYCEQEGIDAIGLLKVDAEGHDLAVLNGFGSMLATGRVDVVQFEFTLFAVYARTWLRDFYDLLTPYGYRIGKLYPTRVAWRDYDAHYERFLRCNFVAVRPEARAAKALGWAAD